MLLLIIGLVLISFSAVLLVGAPYLPTLKPQVKAALELADLQPGDTMLELGCGDGRMVAAAAKQGIHVVGYELNPWLALLCTLRTLKYRNQVQIIWGDFWRKEWPEAQTIFVFLLPRYMSKLDQKVMQYKHKPVKLLSFAFPIPGKKVHHERAGVYLYKYR